VIDLDVGPVTIALADAGKRYSAMQVINEDQWVVAMSNTARESTP